MPSHKDFGILRSSFMKCIQCEYKLALREFVVYCKEWEIEVCKAAKLGEILNVYIHHVYRASSSDGKGHANKVSCTVKLYLLEMKEKLNLLHRAMIDWDKIRFIQQNAQCPHDLALGHPYFLPIKGLKNVLCYTTHI